MARKRKQAKSSNQELPEMARLEDINSYIGGDPSATFDGEIGMNIQRVNAAEALNITGKLTAASAMEIGNALQRVASGLSKAEQVEKMEALTSEMKSLSSDVNFAHRAAAHAKAESILLNALTELGQTELVEEWRKLSQQFGGFYYL